MRKIVIFFVLCWVVVLGYSQQEPQWMTPLYFETADGQKDTVYFGYHPDASLPSDVVDTIFGDLEAYVSFDNSVFNAFVPEYYIPTDSLRKVSIRNNLLEYSHVYFVGSGEYPITMKWDSASYYSQNLPENFVVIPNRPRARLDIYPEGFGCFPTCYDDCFYIGTDSIYPEIYTIASLDLVEVFADSAVFNCPDGYNISDLSFMIRIRPFDSDQMWWTDKESYVMDENIKIYPNPAKKSICIESSTEAIKEGELSIYNQSGQTVLRKHLAEETFNSGICIDRFSPGNYFIQIKNGDKLLNGKFVKQ